MNKVAHIAGRPVKTSFRWSRAIHENSIQEVMQRTLSIQLPTPQNN